MRHSLVALLLAVSVASVVTKSAAAAPVYTYDLDMSAVVVTPVGGSSEEAYDLFNSEDPDGFKGPVLIENTKQGSFEYGSYRGQSIAWANFRRGQFGVYAYGSSVDAYSGGVLIGTSFTNSWATVTFSDRIRFDTPDDWTGAVVRLSINLEGSLSVLTGRAVPGTAGMSFNAAFTQPMPAGPLSLEGFTYAEEIGQDEYSSYNTQWSRSGDLFTYDFWLVGPDPVLDLSVSMTALGVGGEAAFDRTATFGLVLPEGVTFAPDSGVFLTEVPEPGTGLLVMTGLLGLAARRKRRA